jgi:ribosome-binding protein aMBF1 (putative translation factor)
MSKNESICRCTRSGAGVPRGHTVKQKEADESARLLAQGIRSLREHRGLTQQGLAERMHVTQSLIARWEDPTYRGWSMKTLVKIGIALRARVRVQLLVAHPDHQEPRP